jgi:hypothetical protein
MARLDWFEPATAWWIGLRYNSIIPLHCKGAWECFNGGEVVTIHMIVDEYEVVDVRSRLVKSMRMIL